MLLFQLDFEVVQMQAKVLNGQTLLFTLTENDSSARAALLKFMDETAGTAANVADTAREIKEALLVPTPKTRLEIKDFPHSSTMKSSPPSSGMQKINTSTYFQNSNLALYIFRHEC